MERKGLDIVFHGHPVETLEGALRSLESIGEVDLKDWLAKSPGSVIVIGDEVIRYDQIVEIDDVSYFGSGALTLDGQFIPAINVQCTITTNEIGEEEVAEALRGIMAAEGDEAKTTAIDNMVANLTDKGESEVCSIAADNKNELRETAQTVLNAIIGRSRPPPNRRPHWSAFHHI